MLDFARAFARVSARLPAIAERLHAEQVDAVALAQARRASKDVPPSPIEELLLKKPWLVPNLYDGRIPQWSGAATRSFDDPEEEP